MSNKSRLEKKWRRKAKWDCGIGWTFIIGRCIFCNQQIVFNVASTEMCDKNKCSNMFYVAMFDEAMGGE